MNSSQSKNSGIFNRVSCQCQQKTGYSFCGNSIVVANKNDVCYIS